MTASDDIEEVMESRKSRTGNSMHIEDAWARYNAQYRAPNSDMSDVDTIWVEACNRVEACRQ